MAFYRIGGAAESLPGTSYTVRSTSSVSSSSIKTSNAIALLDTYKQNGHSTVPFGTVLFEDENIKITNEVTSDLGNLYGMRIEAKTTVNMDGISYGPGAFLRKALSDIPYDVIITK